MANREIVYDSPGCVDTLRDQKADMSKVQSLQALALQSQDAIELLSSKWRITILHLLRPGPLRHSDLQRGITLVSPKMLTQTLRGMERDGLIERSIHRVVPPHVEYQLSPMGQTLLPSLRNLCHWAKANAKWRDEARRRFDHSPQMVATLLGRP
jgi:DNA-binding HxlR family transcriptional regulator